MYTPSAFQIEKQSIALDFINSHNFGQLISDVNGQPFCTHLPFLVDAECKTLTAHLAKQNPQWRNISSQSVLVTFLGPHGYISPNWYAAPGVPTWNYQAVHIYGRCEIIEDATCLHEHVLAMAAHFEANSATPWKAEFSQALLSAIVGLRIHITDIQAKFKLSQNRSLEDRSRVIAALEASGNHALSEAMNACL